MEINNKSTEEFHLSLSNLSNISKITEEHTTKIKSLREQLTIRSREWCIVSSIHGLSNIVRAHSYWRLFFWLIMLLVCSVLCILLVVSNILDYLRYDVITKARTLPLSQDEFFPVVSMCNENPLISPESNRFIKEFFLENYGLNVNTYDDVLKNLDPDKAKNAYRQLLYSMNLPRDFSSFGYPVNNVIDSINFYGESYPIAELESFFDPYYGPCFRFNSGKNLTGQNVKRENLAVAGIGLDLVVFMGVTDDIRDYLYQPSNRGIRIEIKGIL